MKKRVVITGVGVLASGKASGILAGRQRRKVGYKPITLFDASEFRVKIAGEISDFDARSYMVRLKIVGRSTKLMIFCEACH